MIADADEMAGDIPAVSKASYEGSNRKNSYGNMNRKTNDSNSDSAGVSRGIFDVPLTDLSLLFSSISTSNNNLYNYGTKTHNLGMNLKDV